MDFIAVTVKTFHNDIFISFHVGIISGDTQAAFFTELFSFAPNKNGIDQFNDTVTDIHNAKVLSTWFEGRKVYTK